MDLRKQRHGAEGKSEANCLTLYQAHILVSGAVENHQAHAGQQQQAAEQGQIQVQEGEQTRGPGGLGIL
jgi:hypothetical protein